MENLNNYSLCTRCLAVISLPGGNFTWVDESDRSSCYGGYHLPTNIHEYESDKFNNDIQAEILFRFSLDSGQDEELGEAETFGWFALFASFGAILNTDCVGSVTVARYDSETAARESWSDLESEYEAWEASGDDWREDDRTDDYAWDYAH